MQMVVLLVARPVVDWSTGGSKNIVLVECVWLLWAKVRIPRRFCPSLYLRLLIYYVESLDELADLANALFSPISNRGRDPVPMINDHPFGPAEKGVRPKLLETLRC